MDSISRSTQRAIRRERQLNFSPLLIASDRGLDIEDVLKVLAGSCPEPLAGELCFEATRRTALREMKAAERGDFGKPTGRYVRAVKWNWCDVVDEYREEI